MIKKIKGIVNNNSNPKIDTRFEFVYINDVLNSKENNGVYLVENKDNSYTVFLWIRGVLLSKNPITLYKRLNKEKHNSVFYLKDNYNRKYIISKDSITICKDGEITEFTNKET